MAKLMKYFVKWIFRHPETNLFALPFFLFFQTIFGLFLFKTRFIRNRIFINLLSLFCLYFINITLPTLFWPFRNKSNCTIVHMSSCIYIGVINYKLLEILHSPSLFFQRHSITHYWQVCICLITPSIIDFKQKKEEITQKTSTRSKAISSLIEIFILIPFISFICTNIIIFLYLFDPHWFPDNFLFDAFGLYLNSFVSFAFQLLFYGFWIIPFVTMQMLNIPSCAISFLLGDKITIKYMYKSPLFHSFSPRSMWQCWSSVIGQSLKHLIYIPMGGRNRYFVSVPMLFLFNCGMHILWTWWLHRDLSIFANLSIFTILGIAICGQLYAESNKIGIAASKNFWFRVLYVSVGAVLMFGYGTFFMPFWNELFTIYSLRKYEKDTIKWTFYPVVANKQFVRYSFVLIGVTGWMLLLFVFNLLYRIGKSCKNQNDENGFLLFAKGIGAAIVYFIMVGLIFNYVVVSQEDFSSNLHVK